MLIINIAFSVDMNAGSGHNLDLSLGISQPTNDPKGNDNLGDGHCSFGGCEIPIKERQAVLFSLRCPKLGVFFFVFFFYHDHC